MRLKFLHLHLHGLIRSKNLELGRDADTGGQTQYVLELIKSLANTSEVDQVDLVTRLIKDPKVEDEYSQEEEFVDPGVRILRFKFGPNKYLRKELLWPYLDHLTESLISVSYTHLRAHETVGNLVCRLLLENIHHLL